MLSSSQLPLVGAAKRCGELAFFCTPMFSPTSPNYAQYGCRVILKGFMEGMDLDRPTNINPSTLLMLSFFFRRLKVVIIHPKHLGSVGGK